MSKDRVEGDEQDRDRNRGRNNDRGRDNQPNKEKDIEPSYFWRVIQEQLEAVSQDLGEAGITSKGGMMATDALEEFLGPDLAKFALDKGLPFVSAWVNRPELIKKLIRARGWPEPINEIVSESFKGVFEGVRRGARENGTHSSRDLHKHLAVGRDELRKKLVEDLTYGRSILMLDEDVQTKMITLFFALKEAPLQARFSALQVKLKTPADIKFFLKQYDFLLQENPTATPKALLELIEPAYGIKPQGAPASPSVAGIFDRLKKAVSKYVGKADKAVTEAIEHPEHAFEAAAAGMRSANERKRTERDARKRRINELKGMR